ncbi:MAG TPA: imidazole glycerol phosphate synthase subunit HisH [Victivallales bacterium]|nr:imidazole glycerol phosphate synthase subunit HisH [Victivallales bacterium]HPO90894.1 imidazole glycerol phosphate synthase subunit HisH [Victivallales bacterium]HRR06692.1 imidazole glycerol phosphate synthase subunit HisH [Victivallales bacterium]HRR29052.1 imidazole glycerol phosphate synthase subunit HisH [Victivallales bacterium]HRU01384.1 imidazole glycerol phosphate synthase subunit HisH [Victivallales bacterium]
MIYLIDYGMGNLFSVEKAFRAVGAEITITSKPEDIKNASAIVLPGVGNFGKGISNIRNYKLEEPIKTSIQKGKLFFGICLGMQLLMDESDEAPGQKGLSIFNGKVVKFKTTSLKVPQIGWNCVNFKKDSPYFHGIKNPSYFYFVHSFFVKPQDERIVAGVTEYGESFPSVIYYENIFATQFHPEKSQQAGLQILKNFVELAKKIKTKNDTTN